MPNCPHILPLQQLLRIDLCWSCWNFLLLDANQFNLHANVSEMLYNLSPAKLDGSDVFFVGPMWLSHHIWMTENCLKVNWKFEILVLLLGLCSTHILSNHSTSPEVILIQFKINESQLFLVGNGIEKMGRFWFSWLTFLWSIKPNYSETLLTSSSAPLTDTDMIISAHDNILSFHRELSSFVQNAQSCCCCCPVVQPRL